MVAGSYGPYGAFTTYRPPWEGFFIPPAMRVVADCINKAAAADATLAGRPASALPSGRKPPLTLIEEGSEFYGRNFIKMTGESGITSIMRRWGPGSRGIVQASRGKDIAGHTFNVVNKNGMIVFTDLETGLAPVFEGQGYLRFYLLRTD
jgi:hypothetical protein